MNPTNRRDFLNMSGPPQAPPQDPKMARAVGALAAYAQFVPSSDNVIGTVEGWVPAMAFVRVNHSTRQVAVIASVPYVPERENNPPPQTQET